MMYTFIKVYEKAVRSFSKSEGDYILMKRSKLTANSYMLKDLFDANLKTDGVLF